jgi:hypothetical protein
MIILIFNFFSLIIPRAEASIRPYISFSSLLHTSPLFKYKCFASTFFWKEAGLPEFRQYDFRQLGIRQYTLMTFANSRESTVLWPIGESPLYFRQYTSGLSPLANVQLAKVLLAKFENPDGSVI